MLTIAIQAGGKSRRMGQDKAMIPFLGQPLIARVLARVSPFADEALVTAENAHDYQFLGSQVIPDLIPGRGALGGLCTALSAASQPLVGVIACDMPFINAELLIAQRDIMLQTGADIVIPHLEAGLEPFHAIYRRETCLPHVVAAVENDKWRVDAWFERVRLHEISLQEIKKYDPQLLSFWNLNTPQDLQEAVLFARKQGDVR